MASPNRTGEPGGDVLLFLEELKQRAGRQIRDKTSSALDAIADLIAGNDAESSTKAIMLKNEEKKLQRKAKDLTTSAQETLEQTFAGNVKGDEQGAQQSAAQPSANLPSFEIDANKGTPAQLPNTPGPGIAGATPPPAQPGVNIPSAPAFTVGADLRTSRGPEEIAPGVRRNVSRSESSLSLRPNVISPGQEAQLKILERQRQDSAASSAKEFGLRQQQLKLQKNEAIGRTAIAYADTFKMPTGLAFQVSRNIVNSGDTGVNQQTLDTIESYRSVQSRREGTRQEHLIDLQNRQFGLSERKVSVIERSQNLAEARELNIESHREFLDRHTSTVDARKALELEYLNSARGRELNLAERIAEKVTIPGGLAQRRAISEQIKSSKAARALAQDAFDLKEDLTEAQIDSLEAAVKLNKDEFKQRKHEFGITTDITQDKLKELIRQFDATREDTAKQFDEDRRRFGLTFGENQRRFTLSAASEFASAQARAVRDVAREAGVNRRFDAQLREEARRSNQSFEETVKQHAFDRTMRKSIETRLREHGDERLDIEKLTADAGIKLGIRRAEIEALNVTGANNAREAISDIQHTRSVLEYVKAQFTQSLQSGRLRLDKETEARHLIELNLDIEKANATIAKLYNDMSNDDKKVFLQQQQLKATFYGAFTNRIRALNESGALTSPNELRLDSLMGFVDTGRSAEDAQKQMESALTGINKRVEANNNINPGELWDTIGLAAAQMDHMIIRDRESSFFTRFGGVRVSISTLDKDVVMPNYTRALGMGGVSLEQQQAAIKQLKDWGLIKDLVGTRFIPVDEDDAMHVVSTNYISGFHQLIEGTDFDKSERAFALWINGTDPEAQPNVEDLLTAGTGDVREIDQVLSSPNFNAPQTAAELDAVMRGLMSQIGNLGPGQNVFDGPSQNVQEQ